MAPLQREVYKSVLESNLSMLATFASTGTAAKVKKTNLKNILMQLRKCVTRPAFVTDCRQEPRCMQHPYLTSPHLEVANLGSEEAHRQLVEASGKLKLLALLLPKLRERGHRVLIFSQVGQLVAPSSRSALPTAFKFKIALDIIEDFVKGGKCCLRPIRVVLLILRLRGISILTPRWGHGLGSEAAGHGRIQ